MPVANSIDPLRILPTSDAMSLSHDINRTLDRITQHLSNRYGFSGPVKFYNGVDLGQNGINNVGTSTTPSNAATVEQLAVVKAQIEAQGLAIAGIALRPAPAASFVTLVDGPGAYTGQAGKGVRVGTSMSALEYVDLVTSILGLDDVPDSFAGQALKVLQVTPDETALQWAVLPQTVLALFDTPDTYVGQANRILRIKGDESGIEFVPGTGGIDNFLSLLDTPNTYTGQEGKVVAVNATANGLEFIVGGGGGGATTWLQLLDTPDTYAGAAGAMLRVNAAMTALEYGPALSVPVPITQGGTGATTVPGAQSALGLVPGVNVQQYDALLAALAALTTSANTLPYFTGPDTVATTAFTAAARTFVGAANVGEMRTQLGLQDLALLDTVGTAQIDNGSVTFAKMQDMANQRVLGRSNGVAGPPHEITVGAGLALAGGVLSATGSGGGGTTITVPDRSRKRVFMHMGS